MENEHNLGNVILYAKKLNNIGRWANEFLHRRPSVAEHSFAVCQIAQLLGIIEEANGATVNWHSLYQKALNHDMPESVMGDVISTTKYSNKVVKVMLDEVEEKLVDEYLLGRIDEKYRERYKEILFDGKDDSLEGSILRVADSGDALLECIQEVRLHNFDPFLEKYFLLLDKIKKVNTFSAKYFVEKIVPYLIRDCDELKA